MITQDTPVVVLSDGGTWDGIEGCTIQFFNQHHMQFLQDGLEPDQFEQSSWMGISAMPGLVAAATEALEVLEHLTQTDCHIPHIDCIPDLRAALNRVTEEVSIATVADDPHPPDHLKGTQLDERIKRIAGVAIEEEDIPQMISDAIDSHDFSDEIEAAVSDKMDSATVSIDF